jgi:hypothetical protein
MDNILTVAELKRRGMAAIEDGLKHGPVRIVKRNKPAAVIVSASEYERLLSAGNVPVPGMTALQWLLAHPSTGRRSKREIDRGLREDRDW